MSDPGSPSSELTDVLREIGLHDPLALIYESKEEQFATAIPAIRVGIERREKCIYVIDENTARDVIDALRDEGIDIGAAVESGSLAVLAKQDTYLREGKFVPDKMIRFWEDAADASRPTKRCGPARNASSRMGGGGVNMSKQPWSPTKGAEWRQ